MSVGVETPIYDQKRTILCTTKLNFQESFDFIDFLSRSLGVFKEL